MTPELLKSLGLYIAWAFVGAVVATGLQLATLLAGTDDIAIRPLLATFMSSFFGAVATILGTSQLARFGSEGLAKQVDALKARGVPRSDMVVVTQGEADRAFAAPPPPPAPTAEEIAAAYDRLRRERVEARLKEASRG